MRVIDLCIAWLLGSVSVFKGADLFWSLSQDFYAIGRFVVLLSVDEYLQLIGFLLSNAMTSQIRV